MDLKEILLAMILIIAMIVLISVAAWSVLNESSAYLVKDTEIAVVYKNGEVIGLKDSGSYVDFFQCRILNINNETNFIITGYSKDEKSLNISFSVQYKINKDNIIEILKEYKNLEKFNLYIKLISTECAQDIISKESFNYFLNNKNDIFSEINKKITNKLDEKIDNILITEILI